MSIRPYRPNPLTPQGREYIALEEANERLKAENARLREQLLHALEEMQHPPHWRCKTHGKFDAFVAVGCP